MGNIAQHLVSMLEYVVRFDELRHVYTATAIGFEDVEFSHPSRSMALNGIEHVINEHIVCIQKGD